MRGSHELEEGDEDLLHPSLRASAPRCPKLLGPCQLVKYIIWLLLGALVITTFGLVIAWYAGKAELLQSAARTTLVQFSGRRKTELFTAGNAAVDAATVLSVAASSAGSVLQFTRITGTLTVLVGHSGEYDYTFAAEGAPLAVDRAELWAMQFDTVLHTLAHCPGSPRVLCRNTTRCEGSGSLAAPEGGEPLYALAVYNRGGALYVSLLE